MSAQTKDRRPLTYTVTTLYGSRLLSEKGLPDLRTAVAHANQHLNPSRPLQYDKVWRGVSGQKAFAIVLHVPGFYGVKDPQTVVFTLTHEQATGSAVRGAADREREAKAAAANGGGAAQAKAQRKPAGKGRTGAGQVAAQLDMYAQVGAAASGAVEEPTAEALECAHVLARWQRECSDHFEHTHYLLNHLSNPNTKNRRLQVRNLLVHLQRS